MQPDAAHGRQIRSTTPLNSEIRRRTVGTFPNDAPLLRFVCIRPAEQDDEWSGG
jgi:transposase-like protein